MDVDEDDDGEDYVIGNTAAEDEDNEDDGNINDDDLELLEDRSEDNDDEDDEPLVDMDLALQVAAFEGHFDCVKVLVERGHVSVNLRDDQNTTALTSAAVKGHIQIVQWLLGHGAEIAFEREEGMSDIHSSIKSAKVELLKMILDNEQVQERGFLFTLGDLPYAAESGGADMVIFILESGCFPSSKSRTDSIGLSPEQREAILESLALATIQGSLTSLRLLLPFLTNERADGTFEYIELPEFYSNAIFNATEDAMEETGDSPTLFELVWETLLFPPSSVLEADHAARVKGDEWLSRRLISACTNGCVQTVKLLCEKYSANVNHISHKYYTTPLGRAAGSGVEQLPGRVDVARYLLAERNADIQLANGQYVNGETPLALAVKEGPGQMDMIRLLLDYGGPLEELDGSVPKL